MSEANVSSAPQFSILLPTHNRSDVLYFAIRSVLAQTVSDFELLVVGDGCTDDTRQVVKSFNDPRVIWFDLPKAPNFGYANRNVALRTARGELIAFMAHDDLWFPDHLESLAPAFVDQSIELVYSRPLWVIPPGLLAPTTFNLEYEETLNSFLHGHNSIPAACVVHRRQCFLNYGYWNESLPSCADWDMWARIIEGGGRKNFTYFPEPTSLHFRANWRTEASTGQPQLLVWKRLHALEEFMPAELKIHIPEGLSEQEAVWQHMSRNPGDWVKKTRSAVRQILDARISESDELLGSMLKVNPSLTLDAEDLGQLVTEMAPVLRFSRASMEWKFLRLLVQGKRRALPVGTRRQKLWSRIVRRLHSKLS
ncbi:MAG TPA: glycosyltransferase [Pyrinomonadaceae bacterium]|nr:glycosyltransferase [Pyrinomonadaceae bacterium]